jgi:transglutaminase-like putative cysteine protease
VTGESIVAQLKRANARQPAEEDIRVRVCVLLAVMAAALAVVVQGVGSPVFRLLVVGGLPAAYWYSWRTRHQEGLWVKAVVAVCAIASLGWFLHAIAPQQGGTFADAEIPLAQLLLLIQVFHGLDVPARRDLLFSLLSSAVLLTVAGALSVSMSFVPYLVVWSAASVSALVLAHRSELGELAALVPVEEAPTRRSGPFRPVAAVIALTVVGGLGLFLVVPPAGTARALLFPARLLQLLPLPTPGELSNSTLGPGNPAGARPGSPVGARASFGYFGFSTSVDLGVRGRPGNTVVIRVRADRPALWRGQSFDSWDGRTWTMSDQRTETLVGPLPITVPPPAEDGPQLTGGPELVQTFYVGKPGPNLIFGAAPITSLYFPDSRVYELSDGTLRARVEVGHGAVYTSVSRPPAVSAGILRRAGADGATTPVAISQRYASPPVITPRVEALARQVTAGAPTTYDKVLALEDWMAANTRYTLDIPPLPKGADAVDQFLFVDRRGFCEQIATSLVVMLRSLGVPSRVVAGYAPGVRNPFTGLFEVRASDAHLWAEVWFPGVGWQSFDPTAVVPLAGDAGISRAGNGLGAYLGRELAGVPDWLEALMAVAAGLALVVGAGRRVSAAWAARRRRPQPSWAECCQARLERAGAAQGRPRHDGETVMEYAAALGGLSPPFRRRRQAQELEGVARVVSRAAFSGQPVADDERRWVEEVLDEVASAGRRVVSATAGEQAVGPRG